MNEIKKDHILSAIQEINEQGIRSGRHSSTYDLVYEGKVYPPKLVISIANRYATGTELNPNEFYGGPNKPAFDLLQKEGFTIVPKKDVIKEILDKYKKHIQQTHLQDEKYKWELLEQYKGRPNLEAADFLEEIKGIKYNNLIYPMALAVLHIIIKANTEAIRSYFKDLFNDSLDLSARVSAFTNATEKVYRNNGGQKQHHQDERSIATYLTFFNPEKYTFYKYSFYKKLCDLLNEKEAKKNEKYQHYLLLLNRIIEEYIQEDAKLISLVKSYVPEYDGSNHLLLAQDILYQMLDKQENVNEVNVKEEFIDWMVANVSGGNYFANQFASKRERFEKEINDYEVKYKESFNTELFIINATDYKNEVQLIRANLYNTTSQFSEYSNNHATGRPKAILGKKNYLRFLEEKFGTQKATNYWIFQGNPKFYDIVGALQEEVLTTWKVAAHKDKIKMGDKVILWLSGENAGCYALAKVTSEVGKIEMNPDEIQYYKTQYDENEDRVSIEIEHNLSEEPILWEEIQELPELVELKVGKQGTNFSATEEEYNTIKNLIPIEYDIFEKVLQKFDPEELKKYFTLLFETLDTANLKKGDSRMLFSYNNRKLSFSVGQRIALIIRNKSKRGKFLILSKGIINDNSLPFASNPPVLFYTHIDNLDLSYNDKKSVFEGIAYELNRVKSSGYRNKNYNDFENAVFDPLFRARFQQQNNKMMKNEHNLNQILFGPPGTGKTFNTINEALKIVDSNYFETHQNDRKKLTERFKELLIKNSDENKGQIAFCTFHQSFSYEDFVEGIKPKTTEAKSVYYDVEPGIFKRICQLADSYNSTVKVKKEGKLSWSDDQFRKASFYKLSLGAFYNPSDKPIYEYCRDNNYIAIGFGQENDFTGLSESQIVEKCDELDLEVTAAQQMNYFIHYLKKGNYVIIGNGNKYVRAIGKVVGDYEYVEESPIQYNHFRKVEWIFVDENIPIEEIYERGLSQKTMYKIDETALKQDFFTNNGQEALIEVQNEEKKYVLIIDEINRGNVSSIFGELITLIEKDKRAGCDEELEVTLPYSKEPFKVPNNVYLIGTMNTADRSIEALDTALRRRFSFKEFPPKTHLIKTESASGKTNGIVDGIDLEKLLITINTRIEKLIDKDHRIGHSYFLKVDTKKKLVHAFKNEIIPLLEEYFFGDYGKIGLVLGSSFVEKINHDFSFAEFTAYDTDIQSDLKEKAVFRIQHEDQWDFSKI